MRKTSVLSAVMLLLALLAAGCGASAKRSAASGRSAGAHARADRSMRASKSDRARPSSRGAGRPRDPVLARLGLAPVGAGSPLPGYLLIADRGNNRLVIVSPKGKVVWRYPASGAQAPLALSQPDDAFISPDGRYISLNEEFAEIAAVLTLSPHPRLVFAYGHTGVAGSAPGYLDHPDDAYLLPNGQLQLADIVNCRVLRIDRAGRIVRQFGVTGDCAHDPPRSFEDPNGDTPLPDGGMLVTEIGGWVDRLDARGRLLWSIRTPTYYPSDAQLLPGGDVLVASYTSPGRVDILTPRGRILWTYGPSSGPGALNHPSLAMPLPGGMIVATDDYDDRVVVIDRASRRIVWQYGHDGVPGSAPGYLNIPDGLDLLP